MTNIPPFTPIKIDRNDLTIMGVPFPDLKTLNEVAFGIGGSMYEGFVPTPELVELIRDCFLGKMSTNQLVQAIKEKK
jgi:hypothetical protein